MENNSKDNCEYRILCALRRIIRAVDIYSRKLNNNSGLTTPQLLCLHSLEKAETMTLSELTREVNLSGSTVNGIVDRLEAKGYVIRKRSTQDRRRVYLHMTEAGKNAVQKAPSLLQDKLSSALAKLPESEQATITAALEQVVGLMELENVETSPNLIPASDMEISA
jgi:DNA-binding MarR family transcriptional regulator